MWTKIWSEGMPNILHAIYRREHGRLREILVRLVCSKDVLFILLNARQFTDQFIILYLAMQFLYMEISKTIVC